MLAEIPIGEGFRVFVFGFGGVFSGLGLLYAGLKIVSLAVHRLGAGKDKEG